MRNSRIAAIATLIGSMELSGQSVSVTRGLSVVNFDTTCERCSDFYAFANGGWLTRTVIPPSYSEMSTRLEISERSEQAVRELLEDANATASNPSSSVARVYYSTCMDTIASESAGLRPLQRGLARIAAISSQVALRTELAREQLDDLPALIQIFARADPKNSTRTVLWLDDANLGLPDRDYYTRGDSASSATRTAYEAHIAREYILAGFSSSKARRLARHVLAIETQLARASLSNVERRDPQNTIHSMSISEVEALSPVLAIRAIVRDIGAHSVVRINVVNPQFLKTLDFLLRSIPLPQWKAYLQLRMLEDASPWLPARFAEENFRMEQLLTGAQEHENRSKRCLRMVRDNLSDALGREYVARSFSPEAKKRALDMVKNIESVLRDRLGTLDWLSEKTRTVAIRKLDSIINKIGFPDSWIDYSSVKLSPHDFLANRYAVSEFNNRRYVASIGKAVDRSEWSSPTTLVNSFYDGSARDITFPAAILQPPFFDSTVDDAVNYGAIGVIIGHEITHAFDDEGRQVDDEGNLRNWWTTSDAKAYSQRAGLIAKQFDSYAVDSLHVNGKLTLGENIADLGGLKLAYEALERAISGKRPPLIDGFTPEQRFFLSYAQMRRRKMRPQFARKQVLTDVHSPARWRVNGPLSNMPEFASAFGCSAGMQMSRPDSLQPHIW